jgi:hypothetical protein
MAQKSTFFHAPVRPLWSRKWNRERQQSFLSLRTVDSGFRRNDKAFAGMTRLSPE